MKKQINPTIKAHLIRGAFYLLLLVAVCAIPFALAQRNTIKRTANPVTKLKMAANKVAGPRAARFSSAPTKGPSSDSRILPFDVRQAPKLPRTSQAPLKSSGNAAAHVIPMLPAPKAPQVVLYDQYNNNGLNASLSATFTDFPDFSSDLADDFVVPGGETWNVQSIDADGVYFNGAGPATDWNVFIYTDNAGFPGTQVYSTTNQAVQQNGTTFTVTLNPAAVLSAGHYWIEIQANMNFGTQGEWGWTDRTVQSNNPAAFQNPGGGFACPGGNGWVVKTTCILTVDPDQVYRINGTTGGGGSPTPIPTCTPGTGLSCVDRLLRCKSTAGYIARPDRS